MAINCPLNLRQKSSWTSITALVLISMTISISNPRRALSQKNELATTSNIYLGVMGDYTQIKGTANSTFTLFVGRYFASQRALKLGVQSDISWFNQQNFYDLGAELGLLAEWRFNEQAARPFVLLGGGLNAESIGSFNVNRYPLGFGTGVRLPVSTKGFFQIDYKYRYILNDPIEDFSLHRISVGAAILLD